MNKLYRCSLLLLQRTSRSPVTIFSTLKDLPASAQLLDHYITVALVISRAAKKRREEVDEEGSQNAINTTSRYMMKFRLLQEH